jgi:hypothetical protein
VRVMHLAICLLLVASGRPLAGSEPLTVRVMPVNAVAPADILIQAFVEPNEQNRSLEFAAESDTIYTSSTSALDGDRAARAQTVRFRSLPPGDYAVRVTLVGTGGERAQIIRWVVVV